VVEEKQGEEKNYNSNGNDGISKAAQEAMHKCQEELDETSHICEEYGEETFEGAPAYQKQSCSWKYVQAKDGRERAEKLSVCVLPLLFFYFFCFLSFIYLIYIQG